MLRYSFVIKNRLSSTKAGQQDRPVIYVIMTIWLHWSQISLGSRIFALAPVSIAVIIHDPDKLIEVIEQRDLLVCILLAAQFDSCAAVAATLIILVNPKFHNNAPFHGGIRSSQSPADEILIMM